MKSQKMIAVYCPHCKTKLKARPSWAGQRARCSSCNHRFDIVFEPRGAEAKRSKRKPPASSGTFVPPVAEAASSDSSAGDGLAVEAVSIEAGETDTSMDIAIDDPLDETGADGDLAAIGEAIDADSKEDAALKGMSGSPSAPRLASDSDGETSEQDVIDILNDSAGPDDSIGPDGSIDTDEEDLVGQELFEDGIDSERGEADAPATEEPAVAAVSPAPSSSDTASRDRELNDAASGDRAPADESSAITAEESPATPDEDEPTVSPNGSPPVAVSGAGTTHREGERIAISGRWTEMLDWGRRAVVVELDPDLAALFGERRFDALWPHDPEYVAFVESLEDKTRYLQTQWTICYLHHPRVSVVLQMVASLGDHYRLSVSQSLIELLAHDNAEVRRAAAAALWQKGPLEIAHALRQLKEKAKSPAVVRNLCEACPAQCQDELEPLYERNYVSWPGEIETVTVVEPTETADAEAATDHSDELPRDAHDAIGTETTDSDSSGTDTAVTAGEDDVDAPSELRVASRLDDAPDGEAVATTDESAPAEGSTDAEETDPVEQPDQIEESDEAESTQQADAPTKR